LGEGDCVPADESTSESSSWGEAGTATKNELSLFGTWGKFDVQNFLNIEYMQTTFTLSDEMIFDEDRLHEILRPAREIFGSDQLDMDSVLQRAINDERVSTQIIPYLRGDDATENALGKESKKIRPRFFPNIVVAIVPISDDDKETLANAYPPLDQSYQDLYAFGAPNIGDHTSGIPFHHCTSYGGGDGSQVCFKVHRNQLSKSDPRLRPAPTQLQLSADRCRLVIIDGQHRAMALLALTRNSGTWPSAASTFEAFYEGKEFSKGSLDGVQIPLTIVWFPDLHAESELVVKHNGSIKDACRALFSDINNNAIEMDDTSKILLSDSLVSDSFTRYLMNRINGFR